MRMNIVRMKDENTDESAVALSGKVGDTHHAISSLVEELEAIDLYNQRIGVCDEDSLRAILAHNCDEEKEHAAMLLEWLRRTDSVLDHELKDYLFTEKAITD